MSNGSWLPQLIISTVGYSWKSTGIEVEIKSVDCLDHSFLLSHSAHKVRENLRQNPDFGSHRNTSFQIQGKPTSRTTALMYKLLIHSLTILTLKIEYPIESSSQRYQAKILGEIMSHDRQIHNVWGQTLISGPSCHFHVPSHCLDSPSWAPLSYSLVLIPPHYYSLSGYWWLTTLLFFHLLMKVLRV